MRWFSPGWMIIIGFVMVIAGLILPLLMVLQKLAPTFLLIFVAYGLSGGGLMIGFVGAAFIILGSRSRKQDRYYDPDQDHYEE